MQQRQSQVFSRWLQVIFFLSKIFLSFAASPLSQTESFFKCHLFFAHVLKRSKLCSLASKIELLRIGADLQTRKVPFYSVPENWAAEKVLPPHIVKNVTFVPTLFDGISTRPFLFCPGLDTQFVVDTQAHAHSAVVCLCSVIFSIFLGKKAFLFFSFLKTKVI